MSQTKVNQQAGRIIVGSYEWIAQRNSMRNNSYKSNITVDSNYIPRTFKKYKNNENLIRLSKEMRKNGWGFQSKDKEEYFYHPTYDNKKMVNFVYCNTPDGKFYPVPILDRANDKEGLGCSIVTCHSSLKYDVESNEWLDGFKTRKGKRRVKYFDYLDKRQEKKNSFIFNH